MGGACNKGGVNSFIPTKQWLVKDSPPPMLHRIITPFASDLWVSEQYENRKPGLREKAISIWEAKDFFLDLDPIEGAVEAVKEMARLSNTDVFICTSPIKRYEYCPYEKYAWVEKHLGHEFLEQIVLTRDKTVVSADLLIDDRPDITGAELNPTWEHILFTACHNKQLLLPLPTRRLPSWNHDWKGILERKRSELNSSGQ
uniref:5',3'-nucleotidase, mitochondrial n=1 Tax=Leptobrachium leishanense TaxID=445787 RepID=A0A8C5Q0X5_9ANUR